MISNGRSHFHFHIRDSLVYRVIVFILLGVIGFTVMTTTIALVVSHQRGIAAIEQRVAQIEVTYKNSLANDLWSFDRDAVQTQLSGMLNIPEVRYVNLATSLSEAFVAGSPPPADKAITRSFPIYRLSNGRNVYLGTLEVHASKADVLTELRLRAWTTFGLEAARTLLIAVLILLIFQWLVTRHLNTLAAYARRLDLDNLDEKLDLKRGTSRRHDEFEQVAEAINQMRVTLLEDLAERKRAEEERARLLVSEQKVRTELEAARKIDQLRSYFVNSVSHDLKTPLTSLIGFAEFLEDELGGPLTDQQRDFVEQIKKNAERQEQLINDLLDYARVEAGTFELRCAEADLAEVIREISDGFLPQALAAKVSLKVTLQRAPLRLRLDQERIERVLANLLSNAVKFTPPKGVIEVRACRQEDRLRCEVSDTGPGIAPEDQPQLFQRYSQLESGKFRGGLGLGLSICKTIVEAHGGAIGVESALGKGSTFWFTLPGQAPSAAEGPSTA